MAIRVYLLSVGELNGGEHAEELKRQALDRLDSHRREKAVHLKKGAAQNLSIGAGLLLQIAVREIAAFKTAGQGTDGLHCSREREFALMTVSQALDGLKEPLEIAYCRGDKGKPDFRNVRDRSGRPWHFNLSHSGELVICAVSDAEIGVDIQQVRPLKNFRMAERFFAASETETILAAENRKRQEQIFYQLWARKEAYGKLTGEGITAVVCRDLKELEREVFWEESAAVEGYRIALCGYRTCKDCKGDLNEEITYLSERL